MSVEVLRCVNCSAPLRISALRPVSIVTCSFCGTDNRIDASPRPAAPLGPSRARSAQVERERVLLGRPGVPRWMRAFGVGAAVSVLVSVTRFLAVRSGTVLVRQPDATNILRLWSRQLCLVDGNGDGAPDPIVEGSTMAGNGVGAVDAKTGRTLWFNARIGDDAGRIWCAGDALFLEKGGFTVERLDPASGAISYTVKLGDKVTDVEAGTGCARIHTSDGAVTEVALSSGAPAACTPATSSRDESDPRDRPFALSHLDAHHDVRSGDVVVRVEETLPGTSRLHLFATRGGQAAWDRVLDIHPVGDCQPVAADATGMFVVGVRPGREQTIAYAWVTSMGDVRFQRELSREEKTTVSVDAVGIAAGTGFFSQSFGPLTAVDLATGAPR